MIENLNLSEKKCSEFPAGELNWLKISGNFPYK